MSSKEQRLKIIGILIVIPIIIGAIYLTYTIGFKPSESKTTQSANQSTQSSQQTSSKLAEPKDVSPILEKKPELRVDYTKELYNESVEQLNTRIRELKIFKTYQPSKEFCFAIDNVQGSAQSNVNPLKLDVNYNSKASQFEKIASETNTFSIACKQHLEGSTGLFDEYKKQYLVYINNLNELPKVD